MRNRNALPASPHRRTVLGSGLALASLGLGVPAWSQTASINARMSGDISPVHDPCIIKAGETYYLFCTTGSIETEPGGLIPIRTSSDLVSWRKTGFVFDTMPQWTHDMVPRARGAWAPDIVLIDGRYHLYYSVSSFGSNHSAIGLATSPTLDPADPAYGWADQGVVLRSRTRDRYNAIDSNVVQDREGGWWISWGSFWSGLKMARLDPATGKPADDRIHDIAWRPVRRGEPSAIEAPFIISRGDWYYLFASYDFCCRGAQSTYFVACGRSAAITGPYLDVEGRSLTEGGGSLVIDGDARFRAFGHNAVLQDRDGDYLVYHGYDTQHDGAPTLRISPIHWTADGWPRATIA